jgi:hypothetical protein
LVPSRGTADLVGTTDTVRVVVATTPIIPASAAILA